MSSTQALLAGLTAGLAVAVPLGVIGTLVLDLGVRQGTRAALAAGLGVATVDGLYAAAAAVFGASLASALAPAEAAIRVVAATVLAAVAVLLLLAALRRRRASEPAAPRDADGPPARHLYARFIALTSVNPTTAATFAAVAAGLPAAGDDRLGGAATAAFVVGAFAASAGWHTMLATASGTAGRRLPPSASWWTGVAGAALALALAARLAFAA